MAKEFGAGAGLQKTALPVYADRVADETARLAGIKAQWTPPDAMAAAPMAPAAGPKVLVPDYEVSPGGLRRKVGAHWRAADVWDVMEQAALVAHARRGDEVAFVPPFDAAQVGMARHYAHLTERHSAGGMRCASLEAGRAGDGGGGFIDAYVREGDELRLIHGRIGTGAALVVRRVRPSKRGGVAAGTIKDRALVDAVCLYGLDLNAVLRGAGWAVNGRHRDGLRIALAAALDRMQGYKGVVTPK